jgi:hypothetical protein
MFAPFAKYITSQQIVKRKLEHLHEGDKDGETPSWHWPLEISASLEDSMTHTDLKRVPFKIFCSLLTLCCLVTRLFARVYGSPI